MRFREVGEPWSQFIPFKPYFTMELSAALGTKTIDVEIDDTVTTDSHSHTLELVTTITDPSWYPETQRIANKLPQFHKGRRLRTSNWQKFINSLGAAGTMLLEDMSRVANGRYIHICPIDELTEVGSLYPDPESLNANKADNANRLTNPSLSLFRTPFLEPQDWGLKGDWTVDTTESLFGYTSLKCQPGVGDLVTAVQSTSMQIATGETLTAGIYYQTSLASTLAALTVVDFSLVVVLLYEDGDAEASTIILHPGTDSRWHLASLTATATKNVTKVFTALVIEGQPSISPFPLHVGGIQIRKGGVLGSFSFGQTEPFMLESPINNALEPSKDLWFIDSAREFEHQAVPTRIDIPSSPTAGAFIATAIIKSVYRLHTGHLDVAPIGFSPSNNKVGMYVTEPKELLLEFGVAIYDQGAEGFIEMEGFFIEATQFFKGKLWAVGRFDDQAAADVFIVNTDWESFGKPVDGTDRMRYLICLNHLPPATPGDYMEVISMYPLVKLNVGDPVVDLSFQNSDGSVVYFRTATEERFSLLHYDYAHAVNQGNVWLREIDSGVSLT